MCCCFFPLFQYKKSVSSSFFFHFWFSDLTHFHFLSSSVFPALPFFSPSLFRFISPPLPLLSFPLLSLSPLSLSMFLLSCLVLDIGVVDHVNIFVPTCVHFGVVWVVLSPPTATQGCSSVTYTLVSLIMSLITVLLLS